MKNSLFIALCLFIPAYAADKGAGFTLPTTAPITIPKGTYDPATGATYYYGSSPRVTAATPPRGGTPARTPRSTPPADDMTLEAMKAALQEAARRAQKGQ